MNDGRDEERRRRRRLAASLISLLSLLLLFVGWCAVSGAEKEGKLGSISTTSVQVTIGPGQTAPGGQSGGSTPGAGPTSALSRSNRQPPILAEVIGAAPEPTPPPEEEGEGEEEEEQQQAEEEEEAPPEEEEEGTPEPTPTPIDEEDLTPTATATAGPTGSTPVAGSPTNRGPIFPLAGAIGPGSYLTGGIKLSNTGTGLFAYSVTLKTADNTAFGGALRLRISKSGDDTCSYPGQPAYGDDGFLSATLTVLYEGFFTSGNLVGNPAVESAFGDQELPAGQSVALCLEVFYPWSSDGTYQNATVSGTFSFTAKSPS